MTLRGVINSANVGSTHDALPLTENSHLENESSYKF